MSTHKDMPAFGSCTADGMCQIEAMNDIDAFKIRKLLSLASEAEDDGISMQETRTACRGDNICAIAVLDQLHELSVQAVGEEILRAFQGPATQVVFDSVPEPPAAPAAQVIDFPRRAGGV